MPPTSPKDAPPVDSRVKAIRTALMVPVELIDLMQPNLESKTPEVNPVSVKEITDRIRMLRAIGQGIEGTGITDAFIVRHKTILKSKKVRYELISDPCWLIAARDAGVLMVPVSVQDVDQGTAYEMALTRNLRRPDLPPLERALTCKALMTLKGMSLRVFSDYISTTLGRKLGRRELENYLNLLKMGEDCQRIISMPDYYKARSSALEIDKVKDHNKRAELIEMVKAGASFSEICAKVEAINGRNSAALPKVPTAISELDAAVSRLETLCNLEILSAVERRKLGAAVAKVRATVDTISLTVNR